MMRCPICGADGAIVTHISAYKGVLFDKVYCNICQQTSTVPKHIKKEHSMKVSYKGVTGTLMKLEHSLVVRYDPCVKRDGYTLEIADETDGHKHVFENVDVSEIKFIGATVTLA